MSKKHYLSFALSLFTLIPKIWFFWGHAITDKPCCVLGLIFRTETLTLQGRSKQFSFLLKPLHCMLYKMPRIWGNSKWLGQRRERVLDNAFAHEIEQAVIQNRSSLGSILASRGRTCSVLREERHAYIHADLSRLFNINKKIWEKTDILIR